MISRYLSRFKILDGSRMPSLLMQSQPSMSFIIRQFSSPANPEDKDKERFSSVRREHNNQVQYFSDKGQNQFSERIDTITDRKVLMELMIKEGGNVGFSAFSNSLARLLKLSGNTKYWGRQDKNLAMRVKETVASHLHSSGYINPVQLRFMANFFYILNFDLQQRIKNEDIQEIKRRSQIFIDKNASIDEVTSFFQYTASFNDRAQASHLLKLLVDKQNSFISFRNLLQVLQVGSQQGLWDISDQRFRLVFKEAQTYILRNFQNYSPSEIALIFQKLGGFINANLRSNQLVRKLAKYLEEKMQDLQESEVLKIIESFTTYSSKDSEMQNLIQRIHKLIDLGLHHNASSFNTSFILKYLQSVVDYNNNFKPSKKIVHKCLEFLMENDASLPQTKFAQWNCLEVLLKTGLAYEIDTPQVSAFIFKNLKEQNLMLYATQNIINLLRLARKFFSMNATNSQLPKFKTHLQNIQVSSDFMNISSLVKLTHISLILNDEKLIEKRIDDLVTFIPQVPLHYILNFDVKQLILSSNLLTQKKQEVMQQIFNRESLAQEFTTLGSRQIFIAMQLMFHGFKQSQIGNPSYQNLDSILKSLGPKQKQNVFNSFHKELIQTANEQTLAFIKHALENDPNLSVFSNYLRIKMIEQFYDKVTRSNDRELFKEDIMKCMKLVIEQASAVGPFEISIQKLKLTSPIINEKVMKQNLPRLQQIKPGTQLIEFLQTYKNFGSNVRTSAVCFGAQNKEAFQTILTSLKTYATLADKMMKGSEETEEVKSSSSSSDQQDLKEQPGELRFFLSKQFLKTNLDLVVAISDLLSKVPTSLSPQQIQETKAFLQGLNSSLLRSVIEIYEKYPIKQHYQEIVSTVFQREYHLDSNEQMGLTALIKRKPTKSFIFNPKQWLEIMRNASRTNLDAIYFDFPVWRNKLSSSRKAAVNLLIDDYLLLNKNFTDFSFDLTAFNFVTQHKIRNINFINQFIHRLGNNFSKLNYHKLKYVPMSMMRAGLKQSDIFQSIATKQNSFYYQRSIFPSIFTNGVRLQLHNEEWFMKYTENFFTTLWKDVHYIPKSLLFILEGAYFALEQPGYEFLHAPITEILEKLGKLEKFPEQLVISKVLINLLMEKTDAIPEALRIKDQELKKNFEITKFFDKKFEMEFYRPVKDFDNVNLVDKINQVFNLSGDDAVRASDDGISTILVPNSNKLILPLTISDLQFNQDTPNFIGILKKKIAEQNGHQVIILPIGLFWKAKTKVQVNSFISNYLGASLQKKNQEAAPEVKEVEKEVQTQQNPEKL